jgi:hypothetical protein
MVDLGVADNLGKPARGQPGREEPLMRDFEAVLSDLEWRRVRRRVAMHPAIALFRNCGTSALIFLLRIAAPSFAR